jgi:hypothetical protein
LQMSRNNSDTIVAVPCRRVKVFSVFPNGTFFDGWLAYGGKSRRHLLSHQFVLHTITNQKQPNAWRILLDTIQPKHTLFSTRVVTVYT